ncbi:PTS sugar transporter subunit IIB [Enterococcus hulanensis]|uniref:PTS sugar transporter subunit IIB n=1 Tax=Enterococcus hulanensis TaxID=2559929 RepID=A0ABU3EVX5_9ENTE|nr:PTS sugar transporter subunit IIB [Enterococcus hulanensis]MDT2598473.1 PTS sugar transporter subunit IIB [Enterococcus hulanensis]MDT2608022.1 PTS sugar transporter subunit IIB [Enterococcus hulanensis]MDT2615317.1 PTS sugar transporter subunit IIB [Enterococcus hulanensis]MDT2626712.1 PTS sugar transporter subunit IIB [Enterococcus hulanensis]MDT2654389.1 PTS sugar transporter subunit IIB [Enterococcus hulanensis]
MKKINILLVCNAGMSTSLLIEKIEKAGAAKEIETSVDARPVDDVKNHLKEKHVILLGPQVRFKEKQIKALVDGQIPVSVIDMSAYGTMDGEKVLQQALSLVKE